MLDEAPGAVTTQMRMDTVLPYDSFAYVNSLTHLGLPEVIAGLPWPIVVRPIPGSARCDAVGPWPYGSAPEASQMAAALSALRARGLVSLTAFLRPDCPVDIAALQRSGVQCVPLKDHFIYDARETLPARSKKTRYNIATARRRWAVERLNLPTHWPALAVLHQDLRRRRALSKFAQVEASHFERLADVPGADGLAVFDEGEMIAALVVVRSAARVHFLALLGNEQAHRERAHYALYDAAATRWGSESLLCMGGAPSGEDGPGIDKFKRRFATSTRPVTLLTVILDPVACAELTARRNTPGYFPPYRTPAE